MDSYREYPGDFEPQSGAEVEAPASSPVTGSDERRTQVLAYNYWASLLDGRDFPSIEDLNPDDLVDFAPNSLLLDFTSGGSPALSYLGADIREECGLSDEVRSIDDVPGGSLLSRLTDHYMQIIANRAPVGFEAEFHNQRDEEFCYRGIMMPFSSDGDTIDFIYGVINWTAADRESASPPVGEGAGERDAGADVETGAALADRLQAARTIAAAARDAEGRSRGALYRALAKAYDFALAARDDPAGMADILEESGIKAQARAPMTPIAKLVFGADHDKARLTEYAAALANADRRQVAQGGFLSFIEGQAGGLKALVAAERQARRPDARGDSRTDRSRAQLRETAALSLSTLDCAEEFALVITRRWADGEHRPVAVVDDPALVERAIRRATRC